MLLCLPILLIAKIIVFNMAIDFFEAKITPDQVELDPVLVRDIVGTMQHGEITYIPSEYYWVDRENKMWVDVNAPRFSDEEVPDAVEEVSDILVRCIRINDSGVTGYIIDASYCNMPPNGEDINRHDQKIGEGYDSMVTREQVIGWLGTQMELDMLKPILEKQFSIKLGDCAIKAAYEAKRRETGE